MKAKHDKGGGEGQGFADDLTVVRTTSSELLHIDRPATGHVPLWPQEHAAYSTELWMIPEYFTLHDCAERVFVLFPSVRSIQLHWKADDAVVGRGNAGRTMSKCGHP